MNKDKIKQVLGSKYSKLIVKHLNQKGVLSSTGKPITKVIVQHIVNNRTLDLEIMEEINAFVVATEKRLQKINNALK